MSRVISTRLSEGEYQALSSICEKHNVSKQQFIHAIIIDALVEDGFDALRPIEPEGCEGGSESSETCGAATP